MIQTDGIVVSSLLDTIRTDPLSKCRQLTCYDDQQPAVIKIRQCTSENLTTIAHCLSFTCQRRGRYAQILFTLGSKKSRRPSKENITQRCCQTGTYILVLIETRVLNVNHFDCKELNQSLTLDLP